MNTLGERLTQAQHRLGLKKKALAEQLRITPEWYSKIINGAAKGSSDIGLRLDDLLRRRGIELKISDLKLGGKVSAVEEPPGAYTEGVASRIPEQRAPSTRADCQDYVQRLLDAAETSEDPNAFPVIHDRLKKKFHLDEWEARKPSE